MNDDELLAYNRAAWDREVEKGNRWTVPASPEEIARARSGALELVLTPTIPVPASWYPSPIAGCEVLCLASGGGQQGPLFAAAGAKVTVFDNSPAQLARDREVAEREGLSIETVQGDMADLSAFSDARFDLIFHPCSNGFAANIRPVWKEAARVLAPGGRLLSGFVNPVLYLFDLDALDQGEAKLRYKVPYSDLTSLSDEERKRYTDPGEPLCVGHSLEDQIAGQLDAGLAMTGFFEDWGDPDSKEPERVITERIPCFIATRSEKR